MLTTTLVLVRHGRPAREAEGRCYGKLDVGLHPEGREQLRATAGALRREPLAAIYASPRVRATESAEILAAGHGLAVRVDPRLAEIDFGAFEGQRYEDIEQRHPELYREWMEHPTRVRFPGGEGFVDMQQRVLAALHELRHRHAGEAMAWVSHGGVARIVVAHVLGLPDEHLFRLGQAYANATAIDWLGDEPVLRWLNWTPVP